MSIMATNSHGGRLCAATKVREQHQYLYFTPTPTVIVDDLVHPHWMLVEIVITYCVSVLGQGFYPAGV